LASRRFYRTTRDLHLYLGLFISPVLLVYAVSVVLLNHAYLPWGGGDDGEATTSTVRVEVPDEDNSLELAKRIREQLGASAEIGYVNLDQEERRLSFPLEKPGEVSMVRVDLATGVAEIETRRTGVWDAMIYLHRMPGPHNVAIRGNWLYTRLWGWLADATVYLTLFLTATGVYLWALMRAERRAGLLFLGSGALSFFLLVFALLS
jgi:hypothetical protein